MLFVKIILIHACDTKRSMIVQAIQSTYIVMLKASLRVFREENRCVHLNGFHHLFIKTIDDLFKLRDIETFQRLEVHMFEFVGKAFIILFKILSFYSSFETIAILSFLQFISNHPTNLLYHPLKY